MKVTLKKIQTRVIQELGKFLFFFCSNITKKILIKKPHKNTMLLGCSPRENPQMTK